MKGTRLSRGRPDQRNVVQKSARRWREWNGGEERPCKLRAGFLMEDEEEQTQTERGILLPVTHTHTHTGLPCLSHNRLLEGKETQVGHLSRGGGPRHCAWCGRLCCGCLIQFVNFFPPWNQESFLKPSCVCVCVWIKTPHCSAGVPQAQWESSAAVGDLALAC